jgi:CRP-like cAMP-binding protein
VEVREAGVTLGRGESFGEIALLNDVPRTATVMAAEPCELLSLDRDTFLAAVTGYAPSREAAEGVVATRLGGLRAALGSI